MAYRCIDDTEGMILRAIIQIGAREGVKQVSAQKVAKLCGISDGTVFAHFHTKQQYLDAAALYFDRLHMTEVCDLANQGLTAPEIWDTILEIFLKDPDGTQYYNNYTLTFGFDVTANNPRASEFLPIAKEFFKSEKQLDDSTYLILWDYITSMAFYYSDKFICGYLPCNDETKSIIRKITFSGIDGLIR